MFRVQLHINRKTFPKKTWKFVRERSTRVKFSFFGNDEWLMCNCTTINNYFVIYCFTLITEYDRVVTDKKMTNTFTRIGVILFSFLYWLSNAVSLLMSACGYVRNSLRIHTVCHILSLFMLGNRVWRAGRVICGLRFAVRYSHSLVTGT